MKIHAELLEFEWPGVHPLQLLPPSRAWQQDFARLGHPLSFMAVAYKEGTGSFYVLKEEYEPQGHKFFDKIKRDPQILVNILREVGRAADEIFEFGKKWNLKNLHTLTTKELLILHKKLFTSAETLWRKGQIQNLLELHNSYLTPYIRSLIRSHFPLSHEMEVFTALTTGLYKSVMERQDEDFAKLVQILTKISATQLQNNRIITNHWKKYTWMTYGWEGPALSLEYFVQNLLEAKKSKKTLTNIISIIKQKKLLREAQKKYLNQFSPQEQKLVILLRQLLDSKAKRIDAHSQTYYVGDKILQELGRRKGFGVNQLRIIDPVIFASRYNQATAAELNQEFKLVVYNWHKDKRLEKCTGKKAQQLYEKLKSLVPQVKISNVIQGETAYPGKVKGRVRVVLYVPEVKDFKEGEILVTRITDPSFVPIMKKSAAVVTDIGGIICHAAIVSRELKKPCIIGTKTATKILKDGNIVEVDANKGIVKKIK